MTTLIACFIAGICAAGFMTIWFTTAYAEMSAKRNSLAALYEQLRPHEGLYAQARDGPDVRCANGMLETSRMLCHEAAKSYNNILHKPINRIPSLFMGFKPIEKNRQGEMRGEKT